MRKRHQTGSVKKQRGKWLGQWWVEGKRQSRTLGTISKMSKGEARKEVGRIVAELNAKKQSNKLLNFGDFVDLVYFPFYRRKWKRSTAENNVNRVTVHLVREFRDQELSAFTRDRLQDLLDRKAKVERLSFSVVDHLKWDLSQILGMAVAEGRLDRNPALLLFTPREAKRPVRRVMDIKEVQRCFAALDLRERLIAKLATLAGMRAGEIFGLTWGRMAATYADIQQRVYRGWVDTPKTNQSLRKAALSEGLLAEIEAWRSMAVATSNEAWVFPSERMTPLSKDNCWRRSIFPRLDVIGLGWANSLVMRRTHSSLMKALGIDGKLVADQLGHSLDVNQNCYTQTPVEGRLDMVNQLEKSLRVQ